MKYISRNRFTQQPVDGLYEYHLLARKISTLERVEHVQAN